MPSATHPPVTFTQPVGLLERSYQARKSGNWVYVGADKQSCRIISGLIGKLIYIITNLIGKNGNDKRLAELMDSTYASLLNTAEKVKNLEEKQKTLYRSTRLISQSEKLSRKVIKHVDREQLTNLMSKTVDAGIEILQSTPPSDNNYRETLLAIEVMLAAYSKPASKDPVITEEQRQSILKHARQIKKYDHRMKSLIQLLTFPELHEVNRAKHLYKGTSIAEGFSGSYVLKEQNGIPSAIFKPDDENIGEIDNPNITNKTMMNLTGIPPEKMSIREQAAYKLDKGYSRVPRTRKVTLRGIQTEGKKRSYTTGSLQQWIEGARSFDQLSKKELAKISSKELQRLAIQDMRWLNADRHFGNVLLDPQGHVVPIDHGFILPNKADRLVFHWLKFPQMKMGISEECKRYILSLDPEKDSLHLMKLGIEQAAIERMKLSTLLLQEGVKQNLSLHEIASLYINGENPFTLKGMNTHTSFFEKTIVRRVVLNGESARKVTNELVNNYKLQRDESQSNPIPFRSRGWKKSKEIAPGINHFHFSQLVDGRPQSIHAVKISKEEQQQYQLRVIDHSELKKNQKDYDPAQEDQRMPLSSAASALPEALAMINGGYYHYSHDMYEWDLGKYDISDPVGFLRIKGKDAMVHREKPSTNPRANLWGAVMTSRDGEVTVASTEETLKNHTFEALGCGPVLLESGKVQQMAEKVQSIVKKRKPFFNKSFHAPGNFAEHFKERHPRTCFGKDKEGSWYMVVVDGRNSGGVGVSCKELAVFMKSLGCTHAINLDGGGSSQMMARSPNGKIKHLNQAREPHRPIRSSLAIIKRDH